MSIVAALDKVLFINASSKYSVLRMKTEDSSVPAEARSPYRYHDHLIRFTAVGIELPQTDTMPVSRRLNRWVSYHPPKTKKDAQTFYKSVRPSQYAAMRQRFFSLRIR